MDRDKIIEKIVNEIKNQKYELAEQELLEIINKNSKMLIEDEYEMHYCFSNDIELMIFSNKYHVLKRERLPHVNMYEVYFLMAMVQFNQQRYLEAIEYADKALQWNPVNVELIFFKADVYIELDDYENLIKQLNKGYEFIYKRELMTQYYIKIGNYYYKKELLNEANLWYSISYLYNQSVEAIEKLNLISQKRNTTMKLTANDEIQKIIKEKKVPVQISKTIEECLYNELQKFQSAQKRGEKNLQATINLLYRTLYDITLKKELMLYFNETNEELEIKFQIPEIWKKINDSEINKGILYTIKNSSNDIISVVCDGMCSERELDEAYRLNVENIKKHGAIIKEEKTFKLNKIVKQVIVSVKENGQDVDILQNYFVVNNYLLNVSWRVDNNLTIEQINEIEKDVDFKFEFIIGIESVSKTKNIQKIIMNNIENKMKELISKGKTPQEAMEIANGYNSNLLEIEEQFGYYKTINENIINLLNKLSDQIIKNNEMDPFWIDISKDMFKLYVMSNVVENNHITLPFLFEQTKDINAVREIIIKNLDKLNVPEFQNVMVVSQFLNNDKQLKDIVVIIHEGLKIYKQVGGEVQEVKQERIQNKINEDLLGDENNVRTTKKKIERRPIIVKCFKCKTEFKLNWNVPTSEKTFYCKCPNCNAEIKQENPNYRE